MADIPALANEIAELRRLYLTARGRLRDILGDCPVTKDLPHGCAFDLR